MVHAIPRVWKEKINLNKQDLIDNNNTFRNQHLLVLTRMLDMEKLSSKLLYIQFLSGIKKPPTSESTINGKFRNKTFNWPKIHMVARSATLDSYTRMFHFKCSHNILYLNRALNSIGHVDSPLCSYCAIENETSEHLFFECPDTKDLWTQIQERFPGIPLPDITAESAYIGLPFKSPIHIQHIHLIF